MTVPGIYPYAEGHRVRHTRVGVLLRPDRQRTEPGDGSAVVYADREAATDWAQDGHGTLVMWNDEPIRYIPPDWAGRPVVLLRDTPGPEAFLAGLRAARDWLEAAGADMGSPPHASMSLLRATTARPGWHTSQGWEATSREQWQANPSMLWLDPIIGPRVDTFAETAEVYTWVDHWDVQASYARILGNTNYGGSIGWVLVDGLPDEDDEAPCFVSCRVRLPDGLKAGPLPKRPARRSKVAQLAFPYGPGVVLEGTWSLPEVRAAIAAGCDVEVHRVWVHLSPRYPFRAWLGHVEEGRELEGYGATFAKLVGNVLWSQFAFDPTARRLKVHWETGRLVPEDYPFPGGSPNQDHALAEWVTGVMRARLWTDMIVPYHLQDDALICVHTDGAWTHQLPGDAMPGPGHGWRLKDRATRMEFLGPQELRFVPLGRRRWSYICSGMTDPAAEFPVRWEAEVRAKGRHHRSSERQDWEKSLPAADREALGEARYGR